MAQSPAGTVKINDKVVATFAGQPQTVHVTGSDGKDVTLSSSQATDVPCPCTIAIDQPTAPALQTPFDWWVFAALLVPLVLATALGVAVVGYMICSKANLLKTLDKLAQLLSEGDTSKMSLSRVQALLFTYVITFGSLLIIVRTGQFPAAIPDDLAILSGGGLATYVISKAIQGNTNQGPPPAHPPTASSQPTAPAPKAAGT